MCLIYLILLKHGYHHAHPNASGYYGKCHRNIMATMHQCRGASDLPKQSATNPKNGGHIDDGEEEETGGGRKTNRTPVLHDHNVYGAISGLKNLDL